ncbi:MAG: hypothetical protein IT462_15155 [Planctomycetes bacterium]|nr:hypothetical protein [Planctomycetota bacterium]
MRFLSVLSVVACFVLLFSTVAAAPTPSKPKAPPKVPSKLADALTKYLQAPGAAEKERDAVIKEAKNDLELLVAAIRAQAPLTDLKPGTYHGRKFSSGGREWEYSIRLPKDYDGKQRFPVLVLPDHSTIPAEDAISWWENAGKDGEIDKVIVFRPVIIKYQEDEKYFPGLLPLTRPPALAAVMRDGLRHLRLNFAVDHDRFIMTGLSQAGFYTWFYALCFPDDFAAIIPESAGGQVTQLMLLPCAKNLAGLKIRILHARGDTICPYRDAEAMREAIKEAGGEAELITFEDKDFGPNAPAARHPCPVGKRFENILPWGREQKRALPASFKRVLRYGVQGREGWFKLPTPPVGPNGLPGLLEVECREKDGGIAATMPPTPPAGASLAGATYRVPAQAILDKKAFSVGAGRGSDRPVADLKLLLEDFRNHGDPERLIAAEIDVSQ